MVFSDIWFLKFIAIAVPAIWFIPARLRRLGLLVSCVVFHAHYAGPAGMAPIILLAIGVYFALKQKNPNFRLLLSAVCAGALISFKYVPLINRTFGASIPAPAVPLAISFFVFEFIHVLTDRNRAKIRKAPGALDFSIFSIFFPSLVSGPIKRFEQFAPELARIGRPDSALLLQSLTRILLGYFKKSCIADSLQRDIPGTGSLHQWHGSVLAICLWVGIRIFLDFSAYSDIAIGVAGLLNIRLPENFSFPYLARDLSDFWRRWHISLSTWIRDYVYILLGGNRVPAWRKFANLMAAMLLCGLWHGGSSHFALWGLIHGLGLVAVHLWRKQERLTLPPVLAWATTFAFVQVSWLLFFYEVPEILELLRSRPLV
ncbi:MAG: MBOAT family O-acyltransferase [Bdellovibrionota bacterium]